MSKNPKRAAGTSGTNTISSDDGAGAPTLPVDRDAPPAGEGDAKIVPAYAVVEVPGEGNAALRYWIQRDKVIRVDVLGEPDLLPLALDKVDRHLRRPRR